MINLQSTWAWSGAGGHNCLGLEQVGLLEIGYLGLDGAARPDDELWRDCFPALRDAAPDVRERVCRVLLDEMRRSLAIDVECFEPDEFRSA